MKQLTAIVFSITTVLLIGCEETHQEQVVRVEKDANTFKVATARTGAWIRDTARVHSDELVEFLGTLDRIATRRAVCTEKSQDKSWANGYTMYGVWVHIEYQYRELDTIGVY